MKLVIFDVDGTLVNSRAQILRSFSEAFKDLGLPQLEEDRVLSVIGLSLLLACEHLVGKGEKAQLLADHYRSNYYRINAEIEKEGPQLFSGVQKVISQMEELPLAVLGIATGNSRRGVQRILNAYGWQNTFTTIQTADDAPSKPHPEMIFQAIADVGGRPDSTIMVGDTSFDIDMAVAAGVPSIGVTWGNHSEDILVRAKARYIVHTRQELADILVDFVNS